MDTIRVTARATIQDTNVDEFKKLAADCLRIVQNKDSGTLQYDWFLNQDQTECIVLENYKDSDAVLEHVGNLGATFGALLAVADWTFEVFGNPSQKLVEAVSTLSVKAYSPLQSL